MALAKRIIPCLDVNNGRVVKGVTFLNLRDAGDPKELGRKYSDEGADELVFLDITASLDKRQTVYQMVSEVACELNIPFTVGGGVRNKSDARKILLSGADKVAINTAALERPRIINELSQDFGQQCLVVSIDARWDPQEEMFRVWTHGARRSTNVDALKWAEKCEKLGAGELLVTSIDKDGTKAGYDLPLLRAVVNAVQIPVIASGGAGELEHFHEIFAETNADAALAASVFHYGELRICQVKEYLDGTGVPVRL